MRAILAVWIVLGAVPVMVQPQQQISPSGPSDAQPIAAQDSRLKTNGRGAIGVDVGPVAKEGGSSVRAVLKDGPAARAGIQVGDMLLRVDGLDFKGVEQLKNRPPGSQIQIEYRRGATTAKTVVVTEDQLSLYMRLASTGDEYAKTVLLAMNLPDGCMGSFKNQIRWPGLARYIVREIYEKQIRQDSNPNITSKEFQEGPKNTAVVKYAVQITGYSPQNYTIRIGSDGIYTTWTGGPATSFFGVLFDESDSNLHQSSMQYSQLLPVRKVRYGDINAVVPLVKKDKDRDKFENSKDWALVSNQQIKGVDDAYRFADALNSLICDSKGAAELRQWQWDSSIQSLRARAAQWRIQPGQGDIPEQARDEQILAKQAIDEKDMVGVILHYQNALDVYPMLPKAWFNSALAYEQIGAYTEAAEFMKVYVELVPDAPDAQEARAKVVVWEDKARSQ